MIKKLSTLSVAILTVGIISILLCLFSVDEYVPVDNVIGAAFPEKLKPKREINAGMDGGSMLIAALENFDAADYAAVFQQGTVDTRLSIGQILQAMTARRIRQNGYWWLDAYTTPKGSGVLASFSPVAMEEALYDGTSVSYRKAKGNVVSVENGKFSASKFDVEKSYPTLDDYLKEHANDPTKPFMYTVNAQSVLTSTRPALDEHKVFYSFTVELDPLRSTEFYRDVVIQTGDGMLRDVTFKSIKLEVEIWKNGFLKKVKATENYDVKALPGPGSIEQTSDFYFSFDSTEETMQIDDILKYFDR